MSGIFGIIQLDGRPVDVADLERMRHTMAHRGPNGSAIWREGEAGLGQLMLHSTPESLHETLPWKDPESGLVITADARIDNREELTARLRVSRPQSGLLRGAVGGRFAADVSSMIPDSQLILEAYKRWGDACVNHLLGDFAFAIWNPREKRLFCARDHMGVRPFYYYQSGKLLVFASSAQAVVANSRVPGQINEARVADFLAVRLQGVNNRCTFFKEVWRLPPARTAVFSDRGFTRKRYWQPDAETEIRLRSDDEYRDALQDVLSAAVRDRLRSHKPPASMLSGGIDSSTIVGLARQLLLQNCRQLRTYSGISEDVSECRESQNIRRVIEQGGIEPYLVRPSEVATFAPELVRVSARIEDPFDSHCTLMMLMYLCAARDGSVVVMDGLDGDGVASLTSGYPSYLLRDGNWIHAQREIRGQWINYYQSRFPLWRDYWDAVKPLLAPDFFWRKRWNAGYRRMAHEAIVNSYISASLARHVDLGDRFREFHSHSPTLLALTLRHAHAARLAVPYLTAAIERYGRLAAYAGVEQRHPLLDKRVVEFCIGLPWRHKARNGWSKFTLRRVAQRVAPHEIAWRQGWDHISWKFMESWQSFTRPAMDQLMEQELAQFDDYVDSEAFRALLGEIEPAEPYGEKGRVVFYLVQWLAAQRSRCE